MPVSVLFELYEERAGNHVVTINQEFFAPWPISPLRFYKELVRRDYPLDGTALKSLIQGQIRQRQDQPREWLFVSLMCAAAFADAAQDRPAVTRFGD